MKKKIKFYLTSKNRRIRYSLINQEKGLVLIFFHGFMSDMVGEKPLNFEHFAKKLKIGLQMILLRDLKAKAGKQSV